jgi:uroporphyrinogen-III decarboxylase
VSKNKEKTDRVMKAMQRQEPDRLPVAEWFAGEFVSKWVEWRKRQGEITEDAELVTASWASVSDSEEMDPNKYYGLDVMLVVPNSDPMFIGPEVQEEKEFTIVNSGFGCTIKKRHSRLEDGYMAPMAEYIDFSIKSVDDYKTFQFDDPRDSRRFYDPRQDIISGDGFTILNSYMDSVNAIKDDYCIFGGIYEAWEGLWRMRGISNALMDLAQHPDVIKKFCDKIIDFSIENMREQVRLSGCKFMYVWGDLGHKTGLMFSPKMWREIFFPPLKRLVKAIHDEGCFCIYHSCGHNPDSTIEGLIEAGIDAFNPLEVKAGMDALHMKRKYGDRLTIMGGIDNAGVLGGPPGTFEPIKDHILRLFNAGKGGGLILQTDHCVPGSVPPENYDYYQMLRREYGNYPLELGEYDESIK